MHRNIIPNFVSFICIFFKFDLFYIFCFIAKQTNKLIKTFLSTKVIIEKISEETIYNGLKLFYEEDADKCFKISKEFSLFEIFFGTNMSKIFYLDFFSGAKEIYDWFVSKTKQKIDQNKFYTLCLSKTLK
jgi:hypothetical protein